MSDVRSHYHLLKIMEDNKLEYTLDVTKARSYIESVTLHGGGDLARSTNADILIHTMRNLILDSSRQLLIISGQESSGKSTFLRKFNRTSPFYAIRDISQFPKNYDWVVTGREVIISEDDDRDPCRLGTIIKEINSRQIIHVRRIRENLRHINMRIRGIYLTRLPADIVEAGVKYNLAHLSHTRVPINVTVVNFPNRFRTIIDSNTIPTKSQFYSLLDPYLS